MQRHSDFPYLRRRRQGAGLRIEIAADSMRVGKTTAVKVLAEGLQKLGHEVTESYEDWAHNPYLKGSYSDPAKNFLESQKWFVHRKWEQIRDGGGNGIFIQDVAPEMDYCYAETNRRLARMSEEHFGEYRKFFYELDWGAAPAPHLLVYLTASDDVLLARAMSARREFETVDEAYFLTMKRVNREWVEGARERYRVLMVDTDALDYAHNQMAKNKLVEKVASTLEMT